ncbi:MAG: hypothetical protein KDJ35_03635 [Alphaproteobacteria bacterium]|nr:hypothetical protein [Alphaproteobacteria bacterium]
MKKFKVEIIKLTNHLKRKLGMDPQDVAEGEIANEAIMEADRLIEELCSECHSSIGGFLKALGEKWSEMREIGEDTPQRRALSEEIFTLSHEIKDIGSMCGYNLIAHFAESLRDYIEETELNLEAQKVIIQAHYDAMNLAHKNDVKDDDGPVASELKQLVKVAIKKYK